MNGKKKHTAYCENCGHEGETRSHCCGELVHITAEELLNCSTCGGVCSALCASCKTSI